MIPAQRNQEGLTSSQIEYCRMAWEILTSQRQEFELVITEAGKPGSKTRFNENRKAVLLGANAFPGIGLDANSRMSTLACLAHEFSHTERFTLGFRRPLDLPDILIDEAETSLHASFLPVLNPKDRKDLIEDARDRLIQWLGQKV